MNAKVLEKCIDEFLQIFVVLMSEVIKNDGQEAERRESSGTKMREEVWDEEDGKGMKMALKNIWEMEK